MDTSYLVRAAAGALTVLVGAVIVFRRKRAA